MKNWFQKAKRITQRAPSGWLQSVRKHFPSSSTRKADTKTNKNPPANAIKSNVRSSESPDQRALASLKKLLEDSAIPASVRRELATEYDQLRRLLDKLGNGRLHVAAVGRGSSGTSSLLNALLNEPVFSTSVLHGHTRETGARHWQEIGGQSVLVLDTPGSDESDQPAGPHTPAHTDFTSGGSQREKLALQEARLADVVLFVLDGDLTASQQRTLQQVARPGKPVIVVLNKADLYTEAERQALLGSIRRKSAGLIHPRFVLSAAADPRPCTVMVEDEAGHWQEKQEKPAPEVTAVREAIWELLATDGRALSALNASLFAGEVSDRIAAGITHLRAGAAEKVITTHALAKAIAVAFNPVPVADLLLAGGIDVGMIHKLSRVYGLSLTRQDAARLGLTISAQLAALMGAVWGINLASAALKTVSAGLSVTLTGAAQGSLAYYSSILIGQIAEGYFRCGQSWGPDGPKTVAREVLNNLDRQSVLNQAREQILHHLRKKTP